MGKKKVLLMGKAHSGKTSMRSIIFANYLARDTTRLSPTLDVEHHHVRFLGDLVLNLWDCGGQDAFYESYFERDRETIFRSVELLIYVFDIESTTTSKDFNHFCGILDALEENSPDARIFILVHKMDVISNELQRQRIFNERKIMITQSCIDCNVTNFNIYGTSIWDETLYKAWSEIVTNLIPNIRLLESQLINFCNICDAEEVVLFERATFLVISHATTNSTTTSDDEYDDSNDDDEYDSDEEEDDNDETKQEELNPSNIKGIVAELLSDKEPTVESTETTLATVNDTADTTTATTTTTVTTNDSIVKETVTAEIQPPQPLEIYNTVSSDNNDAIVPATSVLPTNNNNMKKKTKKSKIASNTKIIKKQSRTIHFDAHRFEKISNIVKQFKLSCGKAQSQFQGMEVQNSRFIAYIDTFTANTYIMVIVSSSSSGSASSNSHHHNGAATIYNIHNARDYFEQFIPRI